MAYLYTVRGGIAFTYVMLTVIISQRRLARDTM